MGILEEVGRAETWRAFFADKTEHSHLTRREAAFWQRFIENEEYRAVTDRLTEPDFCLSVPEKRLLNKHGSGKKRVVYSFSEAENATLKLIAFLLYRYDAAQSPLCYAFRRNLGAKSAIRRLCAAPGIAGMYSYKLDISNYFNSIDIALLLPMLQKLLADDPALYAFLARLLSRDAAVFEGQTITEKRGVMAGTPISPFLANVFLMELDRQFEARGLPYARYSDDIIVFAETPQALADCRETLLAALEAHHLSVNPDKERTTAPGEPWDFLGIRWQNGAVDLAPATLRKLKGKMKRKARAIRRWKLKKDATDEKAMSVFARAMNRKLYEDTGENRFTWSRWFFPLLTVSDSLSALDAYMEENMRYVACGRYSRANYRISYEALKRCGCRPLVAEYYRFRSGALETEKESVFSDAPAEE